MAFLWDDELTSLVSLDSVVVEVLLEDVRCVEVVSKWGQVGENLEGGRRQDGGSTRQRA